MSTKNERTLAYQAGQHANADPAALQHGASACPFETGTDEAHEWLRGFSDAIEGHTDPVTLRKDLHDAMKADSNVG